MGNPQDHTRSATGWLMNRVSTSNLFVGLFFAIFINIITAIAIPKL
ncbi:hypothetical protein [Nostoc sp. DSM 114161]